jgi:hypothetical protein
MFLAFDYRQCDRRLIWLVRLRLWGTPHGLILSGWPLCDFVYSCGCYHLEAEVCQLAWVVVACVKSFGVQVIVRTVLPYT